MQDSRCWFAGLKHNISQTRTTGSKAWQNFHYQHIMNLTNHVTCKLGLKNEFEFLTMFCAEISIEAFWFEHNEKRAPAKQYSREKQVLNDGRHCHPPPASKRRGQCRSHSEQESGLQEVDAHTPVQICKWKRELTVIYKTDGTEVDKFWTKYCVTTKYSDHIFLSLIK